MDLDAITTAHFRRLAKPYEGLDSLCANLGGRWSASTLGNYHSLTATCVAPPSLMFALCEMANDWAWLDGMNALAGRAYVTPAEAAEGRADD